ncbi:hypothetical protein AAFF_G00060440 [Aldrovandia affinis]|uniref:Uncharacterized protein n=1 Tax=Aldrovandia affinis TaxID=143900 RepID=A0AAD7S047_9TELE|nr:hypothetical protein AAFF_G00060440 [Aldrovandia affinis]
MLWFGYSVGPSSQIRLKTATFRPQLDVIDQAHSLLTADQKPKEQIPKSAVAMVKCEEWAWGKGTPELAVGSLLWCRSHFLSGSRVAGLGRALIRRSASGPVSPVAVVYLWS